jgi:hypothetical protein
MKIIIENQFKDNVINLIKKEGWKDTCQMLGLSDKELTETVFNNDPMEFLNIYNDLDVIQSEENPYYTLFRYEIGNNMMVYNRKIERVNINYGVIWLFLDDGFGLNTDEIYELMKRWLSETYNLRDVTILIFWSSHNGVK